MPELPGLMDEKKAMPPMMSTKYFILMGNSR